MSLRIEKFGERTICIGGIGKMYYQDGFPIEMSVLHLNDRNIETSIFHIADELLRNGFPPKRVIAILNADGITGIEEYCNAEYETQCKMKFNYLFSSINEARVKFNEVVYAATN